MLILRHAWLNLWDKRMTTGRINQVSIYTPSLRTDVSPKSHNLSMCLHREMKTRIHSSVFDHAVLFRWNSPLLDSITWCEKSSTTTWQCRTRFNSSLICPVSLLGFPQQLSQVNRVSGTWVNKVTPIHAGECCVQGHTSDYNRQLLFNLESTHMGLCECFIAHFYS